MKARISFLSILMSLCSVSAFATGWQYDGYRTEDGYYKDDGSRVVIGARAGLSLGRANMKNDMGSLYGYYWVNDETGSVVSHLVYTNAGGTPYEYTYAGYGDLSSLPIREKYSKTAFAAGASLGFTLPNHTNWRLEANYDYISETEFNQTPLLEGDLTVSGGDLGETSVHVCSTGAKSTITTDIISAMVYYDFFDGKIKQQDTFIPYIGFGLGYAISKTALQLTDIYGDLSTDDDLQNYGSASGDNQPLQFDNPLDKEKYPSSTNIAVSGALGFSYGIAEYTFLDISARVTYIPKITWSIANSDGSQHREWFSAENMIYTNLLIGVRFEF